MLGSSEQHMNKDGNNTLGQEKWKNIYQSFRTILPQPHLALPNELGAQDDLLNHPLDAPQHDGGSTGNNDALKVHDGNDAFPVQNGSFPVQNDVFPTQNDVLCGGRSTIFRHNHSFWPVQNDAFPVQNGALWGQNDALLIQNGVLPVQNDAFPDQNDAFSVHNGALTVQNSALLFQNGALLEQKDGFAVQNDALSIQNGGFTVQNGAFSVNNGGSTVLQNYAFPPLQNGGFPVQNNALPEQNDVILPVQNGVLPVEKGGSSSTTVNNGASLANVAPRNQRGKWSEDEHLLFLIGLQQHGIGKWKAISERIGTKSRTQVVSHARKFFARQNAAPEKKKRRSIHDMVLEDMNIVIDRTNAVRGPQNVTARHPDR